MKKNRILSLLLALCMVFSLLSTPALASDGSSSVSVTSSDSDDDAEKKKEEEEKKKKEEEEKKKKEEEEKKKKEEEEKKKEEEEKRKKEEEEEKKKQEEEKKKKEEEERKKQEEEEKKKEEEKDKSDSSDKSSDKSDSSDKSSDKSDSSDKSSDKSDSSDKSSDKSDPSDKSSDKSDSSDKSSDKSDSSDKSSDKSDSSGKADSSGEASSGSGSESSSSSGEDGAESSVQTQDSSTPETPADTEVPAEEQPQEEGQSEEKKDEKEEEEEKEDKDRHVYKKLISDESGDWTMTAGSFSDYGNSTGKAEGAKVSFNRLITYEVTELVPDDSSSEVAKKNLSHIESVMNWIDGQHSEGNYTNAMIKVVIPAGTYYLNGAYTKSTNRCVHLYSNTWLSLNGVTLIKSDTRNRAMIRAGKSSTSVSGYGGESNIIVEGGVIDANISLHKTKSMHFSGVRFGHDHDILIANVHFKGGVSGHHLELCGVKNISVVGCSFTDYRDTGYTKGINRNEAIQIDVTNGSNLTPTYAKYDDTVSGNVVIYKNSFENLSRGVGSHSAVYGSYYQDVVIQGNSFKSVKTQAIHCENYQNCAIVDNTIEKCGGGIDFNAICFAPDGNYYEPHGSLPKYSSIKSYDAKTVIKNNTISVKKGSSLSNASAINIYGGKASSSRVPKAYRNKVLRLSGVAVQNNQITSARSAGVFLAYASNYNVKSNTISGIASGSAARGVGVYLDHCYGGKVQSNKISGTNSHGIYLLSCSGNAEKPVTVHKNTVDATKKTGSIGLYLKKSKYVDVTKNTVSAKSYAVYLSGASVVTIGDQNAGNKLTSSAKYGIYATAKSKRSISAQYNVITAKKSGVYAAKGSKVSTSENAVKATSAAKAKVKATTKKKSRSKSNSSSPR